MQEQFGPEFEGFGGIEESRPPWWGAIIPTVNNSCNFGIAGIVAYSWIHGAGESWHAGMFVGAIVALGMFGAWMRKRE